VHCFEGKSRSTTVVLAYLMLRQHKTLLEAWTRLKGVHCRAQPNDVFMRILIELDRDCMENLPYDTLEKPRVH
jgi:atypical dual specificity phosphatase